MQNQLDLTPEAQVDLNDPTPRSSHYQTDQHIDRKTMEFDWFQQISILEFVA